jgi:tripartite-type tricarboxylate transporter receptor subunit TctC
MKTFRNFVAAVILISLTATAHTWPTKPITIVVPFPPGGLADQLVRNLIPDIENRSGTTVIVKNVPGANHIVALGQVSKETADNHTFIVVDAGLAAGGYWSKPELVSQFRMINVIGSVPFVFSSGINSSLDMLASQTKSKQSVTVATTGHDSAQFLWIASLQNTLPMTPVYYKGGNPAMTDLAGGHVDTAVMSLTLTHQFASTGKIKPLAVSTIKRHNLLPNVPTFREIGWKGDPGSLWYGFMVPAGVSKVSVEKFNQIIETSIQDSVRLRRLEDQGFEFDLITGDKSQSFFTNEIKKYDKIREKLSINP